MYISFINYGIINSYEWRKYQLKNRLSVLTSLKYKLLNKIIINKLSIFPLKKNSFHDKPMKGKMGLKEE